MFQSGNELLRSFNKAKVLSAVKIKVAINKTEEIIGLFEAQRFSGITQPPVELSTNAVEIFWICAREFRKRAGCEATLLSNRIPLLYPRR